MLPKLTIGFITMDGDKTIIIKHHILKHHIPELPIYNIFNICLFLYVQQPTFQHIAQYQ